MGNSSSALPYAIGNQIGTDDLGWNIHDGTKKSNSDPVTVFVGKKPNLVKTPADKTGRHRGMMQLQPAMHHYQQCKKVRHPHILEVYATLDTDNPDADNNAQSQGSIDPTKATGDWIVVTEPCVSLQTWLQQQSSNRLSDEQLAWGLQCMIAALHFLHTNANLSHGLLAPSSFYVNRAGDVKLWNFSLTVPIGQDKQLEMRHFRDWDAVICPATYRSPERAEQRWEAIASAGVHAMDSYSLGILIGEYYRAAGRADIPQPLQKAVQRMLTPNVRMRPRLQPLLKCPIFQSPYQSLQQQISELTIQPVEQKVQFWQQLGQQMSHQTGPNSGIIDQNMAVYKLLPLISNTIQTICSNEQMMAQDMYRREVLATLIPLFFIAQHYLDKEAFQKELKPLVGLLFNVKDRGVRGTLLQRMSLLTENLDASTLNTKVFEPMCSGFSDSSSALRELTLKSTLGLVPYLTAPNLEKLTRYLVRLQADTEVSIRTNTVIFIAKLAPNLTPMAREKMILPAFVRALKDPFAPCRLAVLQVMSESFDFFDPKQLAEKLLPSITCHLLDSDSNVRKQGFKVCDLLVSRLRVESDKIAHQEEMQRAKQQQSSPAGGSAPTSGNAPTAPADASGYLAGFASWVASSAQPSSAQPTSAEPATEPMKPQLPPASVMAAAANVPKPPPAPNTAPLKLPSQTPPQEQLSGMNLNAATSGVDVWDDFGDDDAGAGDGGHGSGWGDDDDFDISNGAAVAEDPFAAIGMKTSSVGTKPMSSGKLSTITKKKLVVKKTAAAPVAVKKLAVDDDEIEDGWDDF